MEGGRLEIREEGCPGRAGLSTQQTLAYLTVCACHLAWRGLNKPEMPGTAVALAMVACVSVQDLVSAKGLLSYKGASQIELGGWAGSSVLCIFNGAETYRHTSGVALKTGSGVSSKAQHV